MKYIETGFRAIYKKFCAFPLEDRFREAMNDYPNIDNANCMLVYGYIDKEAGLTLEVLAGGYQDGDDFLAKIEHAKNHQFAHYISQRETVIQTLRDYIRKNFE